MACSVVDSPAAIANLVDSISNLQTDPPSLYLDLEGINLCRYGSISIIQFLVHPQGDVYLIDVHVLKNLAFDTVGSKGETLKSVLESPIIPKVFFDVRNDSDALYSLFGVALQGVEDIQLMENASRPGPALRKRLLSGLSRCIEKDAVVSSQEKQNWMAVKEAGKKLFAPERGGSYDVFNARPLKEEIKAYCIQDVRMLPCLRDTYSGRLDPKWKVEVKEATERRVQESQSLSYQPSGKDKALSPW